MPPFLPWGLETCCDPGPPAFPAHPLPRSSLLTSPRPRSSGQLTRPFPPQGLWSGSFSPIQPQLKHHREEKHPLSIFSKTPLPWLSKIRTQRFHCGALCPSPDEGTNTLQAMRHSQETPLFPPTLHLLACALPTPTCRHCPC